MRALQPRIRAHAIPAPTVTLPRPSARFDKPASKLRRLFFCPRGRDTRRVPTLIVETGPAAGQSFSFATRAVVGRGEIADVRIDEPTLSRRHCEIRPGPEGWEIADLGSANGTCLNGQRLADAAPLRRDDRIEVGKVKLRFEVAPTTDSGAMSSGLTQSEIAPSALFQDVLSRIKLFCEL